MEIGVSLGYYVIWDLVSDGDWAGWPAQWPGDLELAGLAALSLMRGMLMWSRPSQRIVFQDTSSERGRERVAPMARCCYCICCWPPSQSHLSRPLHNGKLSGGNLKLAPISLSLARNPISGAGLAAQVEPTFTRRAASPAAHPPGAFPPFHSQHQLFLSTFPFNVRPVLTTPDYFQQEIYSV